MKCLETIFVEQKGKIHEVPCGKCAFCLTNRRSDWMFRIHHEMRNQDYKGWFLTLTYNEKRVPRLQDRRLTLRFSDVQKYLKKLRFHGHYCKYICVGEYGPETQRPHYHMLLWTDAKPDVLEKLWSDSKGFPRGHIQFGELEMASAMYCLKYIIQPKVPITDGREPTRAQFSRGIGISYLGKGYSDGRQIYEYHNPEFGEPKMYSYIDGRKVALPRYYKNKIFTNHQCKMESAKYKEIQKEKETEELRKVRDLGIVNVEKYLLDIRTEQAKRIIAKTKYNTTL